MILRMGERDGEREEEGGDVEEEGKRGREMTMMKEEIGGDGKRGARESLKRKADR